MAEFNKKYNKIFKCELLEKYLELKGEDVTEYSEISHEAAFYLADSDYMDWFKNYSESIVNSMKNYKEDIVLKKEPYNLFWIINNLHKVEFYDEIKKPEDLNEDVLSSSEQEKPKKRNRYLTLYNCLLNFRKENKEYAFRDDFYFGYLAFFVCYGVLLHQLSDEGNAFKSYFKKSIDNITKEESFVIRAIILENLVKQCKKISIDDKEYTIKDFMK